MHLDSFKFRFADGWLVCNIDLQNDQSGRQTLQFVYFLGDAVEAEGLQSAGTINVPALQGARLADQWGADVQRVLWDAVLDAVEASIRHAGTQRAE